MSTVQPKIRTRQTSAYDQYDRKYAYKSWSGTSSSQHDKLGTLVHEETSSVDDPSWKARIARGEIVMNPFSNLKVKEINTLGQGVVSLIRSDGYIPAYTDAQHGFDIRNYGINPKSLHDVDAIRGQAVTNAYAEMHSAEMNVAVTIAEAKKTADTLVSAYKQGAELIARLIHLKRRALRRTSNSRDLKRAMRKGDSWKAIKRHSRTLADQYLQVRYGLRPLWYEMQGALRALQNPKAHRTSFYGFAERESVEELGGGTEGYINDYIVYALNQYYSQVSTAKATLIVESKMNKFDQIAAPFGAFNLFEAGWELVPYSFVVDWFFNTGDTIASWQPSVLFDVVGSCCTTKDYRVGATSAEFKLGRYTENVIRSSPSHLTFERTENNLSCSHARVEEETIRHVDPDRPIIPSLSVNLNTWKVADLLALARNLDWKRLKKYRV